MSTADEIAARAERVNEAALDAERIYWLMVEDEDFGIDVVRALLRTCAEIREVSRELRANT